jgi:hypothetical protein
VWEGVMKERYELMYFYTKEEGVSAHMMKQDKGVKKISSYLS